MNADVFVVDALRTPIGRIRGALERVRPDDLLAVALAEVLKRTSIPLDRVDEVVAGCANQAGEDNRNVARMALLIAGLPESVPGMTINRLCASGLAAINAGARQIAVGEADIVLAGGVESMTRAPLVVEKGTANFASGNRTMFDTSLGWRFPNPKLEALFPLEAMGETAENLVEEFRISRVDQDRYAFESHQKALTAEANGWFDAERVSVSIAERKGPATVVMKDEGPRADSTLERLAKLEPAFRKGGTVTAGNSSTLNDGAACVVLASRRAVDAHGLAPMALWRGAASAGVSPRRMGIGPVPAVKKLCERTNVSLKDVDLIELNEAFAAQSLAVIRSLELDPTRVNPKGGAIALGHPLGASGVRIVASLLHELRRTKRKLGLATLCVGVGQGEATLFEALS
ncbi:MAG: acetyl-CoA C-acyltransferase [Deltaproteobacteria bacterium]|nr:acetyl-CoA C-acyltransferase [Deltaproteobacteria bacterium]